MMKLKLGKKPPEKTELVPPNDPSLPPGPPQMNKPVGSPPPPVELPRTYDECVDRARAAAGGQIEKAHLWAMLAQALATKQLADKVDALNEFLGVYDDDPEDREEGDPDPRFSDAVADGILAAVSVVKDDFLSNPVVQMGLEHVQKSVEQTIEEQRRAQADAAKD